MDAAGQVKPAVGTGELLEWSWTTFPANSLTFTYTLRVPATMTANQSMEALGVLTLEGGPEQKLLVQPDPLVVGPTTTHSADVGQNFQIDLFELTRVIALFFAN